MSWMSTYVVVEISPDTTTSPVFTSVSQATRPVGSSLITASSTPSEIWSAILSGWPSVTDSDVNRYSLSFRVLMGSAVVSSSSRFDDGGGGAMARHREELAYGHQPSDSPRSASTGLRDLDGEIGGHVLAVAGDDRGRGADRAVRVDAQPR